MRYFWLFAVITIVFVACKKDDKFDQAAVDKEIILKYIADNNIEDVRLDTASGLYYKITKEGYGGHPNDNSYIEVNYTGYLADTGKTIFDVTKPGLTRKFELYKSIYGWRIGIPHLQKGGIGTFFIPSSLGYGTYSQTYTYEENDSTKIGVIPANSVLIFDVNLIDFQ
jgi:FKBP-type peptidyl-prolyl cis-trans isomerase FkpA